MIFLLIAGTATPAFLLAASGTFRLACLVIMWTLTVTAAAIRLAWMSAPELAAGSTFVGLGWVAVLALPGVWTRAGVAAGLLMLAGALLYTAGALCYHRRRPDPTRPCSATTRSSTLTSAPPQRASTSRSRYFSPAKADIGRP